MAGDIAKATHILTERKKATGAEHNPDQESVTQEELVDRLRLVLVGTDVDVDELVEYASAHLIRAIPYFEKATDVVRILEISQALWIDGFMIGTIAEQIRQKEEKNDDSVGSFPEEFGEGSQGEPDK